MATTIISTEQEAPAASFTRVVAESVPRAVSAPMTLSAMAKPVAAPHHRHTLVRLLRINNPWSIISARYVSLSIGDPQETITVPMVHSTETINIDLLEESERSYAFDDSA